MQVCSLGQEDPLKKEMTAHPRILAWEIPRTEEPGGLQSKGSQRVGHNNNDKVIMYIGEMVLKGKVVGEHQILDSFYPWKGGSPPW